MIKLVLGIVFIILIPTIGQALHDLCVIYGVTGGYYGSAMIFFMLLIIIASGFVGFGVHELEKKKKN